MMVQTNGTISKTVDKVQIRYRDRYFLDLEGYLIWKCQKSFSQLNLSNKLGIRRPHFNVVLFSYTCRIIRSTTIVSGKVATDLVFSTVFRKAGF